MTEFKRGDRVKVEFEGEVTGRFDYGGPYGGLYVRPRDGGLNFVADGANITLLERPVEPLAVGSVVRSDLGGTWVVSTGGKVHYVGHYGARESGETPESLAKLVRDQPHGFTLIHDGSKK